MRWRRARSSRWPSSGASPGSSATTGRTRSRCSGTEARGATDRAYLMSPHLPAPATAPAASSTPPSGRGRAYALAVAAVTAAVALTRVTWPLFAATPFAPLFTAVAVATQWGGGPAGLLAVALAVSSAAIAFPPGPPAWNPRALIIFIPVSLVANRIIAGRNRTAAALRASEAELRASEAELRATWDQARASEEKLRRAQKMEAVGQLVAGVAHNFNNLLTVTLGYTEILQERRRGDEVDENALYEIRRATERGAALTRQLLAFGRKYDAALARVDLNRTLADLRDILTRVIREDIRLTIAAAPAAAVILIDPHDLEQVILNLVINARDALPAGGTIQVEAGRESIDATNAPADVAVTPGEYVRLRVRDDGTGMTPEVRAHLFEPFFTTKEVGEGTGMGLAFVDGIARHGGGFVAVETAPGKGTTVSVYFPVTSDAVAGAAVTAAEDTPAQGGATAATILLVEDEGPVRVITTRTLIGAGYRVLAAATPAQASALFEQHAG